MTYEMVAVEATAPVIRRRRGTERAPRYRFHHLHRSHRDRPRVWQANLRGSLEARLEPRSKSSRGRRSRMGLESGRTAFSRRCRSSICITRASVSGSRRAGRIPMTKRARKLGSGFTSGDCSIREDRKLLYPRFDPSSTNPKWSKSPALRPTTSTETPNACAISNSVSNSSSARV